jgi:hypothetical protein
VNLAGFTIAALMAIIAIAVIGVTKRQSVSNKVKIKGSKGVKKLSLYSL